MFLLEVKSLVKKCNKLKSVQGSEQLQLVKTYQPSQSSVNSILELLPHKIHFKGSCLKIAPWTEKKDTEKNFSKKNLIFHYEC